MNHSTTTLLTIKEACTALKIGKTKLWELIATKQLDVVRFGPRCTRVKAESIHRLINEG